MQNIATLGLTQAQLRFVDDLAGLLSVWNMPNNAARLYGYLQIRDEPASIDDIASDLDMSRSNVFNAAKLLEQYGNARRVGERGSKRIRFVAAEDPGLPLRAQTEALGRTASLLATNSKTVVHGQPAARLARLARFHADLKAAMEQVIFPHETSDQACSRTTKRTIKPGRV